MRNILLKPDLLQSIRERFLHVAEDPWQGRRVFMENAGGSLRLKSVVAATAAETALPDNAGRANPASAHVGEVIAQGTRDLADIMGARSGVISVGESTTSNVFRVVHAALAGVRQGNVVTSRLDHPSVYDSTRLISAAGGLEWRAADIDPARGGVSVESVMTHVDRNTVLLAIIHAANITGTVNDVAAIARAARKVNPDILILFDGAQHGAHGLVDVAAFGCDAYTVSSYKMFGKIGASAVWLSDRLAKRPHDMLAGKSETSWDLGTREQAGYASWSAVADYLVWLGGHFNAAGDRRARIVAAMDAICAHERALVQRLLQGDGAGRPGLLALPRVNVYGETNALHDREATVAFCVDGMTSAKVVDFLLQRGISCHNRMPDAYSRHVLDALGIAECVRASMGHYTTPEEIDQFLDAIAAAA